jgi:eukaryotic-like serine/threonine-protein kinase
MIGKIIGAYQILAKLGQGPNGAVYEALDQTRGQRVALKTINAELARQTAFRQNLRAQAQALTALQHPRLAPLYAVQQHEHELYLVRELIAGQSLAQALQQSGVLPPEQAVTLAIQTLTALNHAHKFGLVHGGVKPGNLLLTAKDQLKLTDLGLASALGALNVQDGRGPSVLNYCAPEQVRGAALDARSDLYALGATLFEMLTGAPPFRRANDAALRQAHLEEVAPSPRNYFPLIPALLEQAILRALAKDPAARFQSAGEFRQVLLEWASTPAIEAPPLTAPRAPVEIIQTRAQQSEHVPSQRRFPARRHDRPHPQRHDTMKWSWS